MAGFLLLGGILFIVFVFFGFEWLQWRVDCILVKKFCELTGESYKTYEEVVEAEKELCDKIEQLSKELAR